MNMFGTPLPFLEPELRKHLLFLLRCSVKLLTTCNQDYLHLSRLRVRSLSVFALALGLSAQHCTIHDLFAAAHIAPTHKELPNLAALVADKFVQYRSLLPPPLDQTGFSLLSWNVTAVSPNDHFHKASCLC